MDIAKLRELLAVVDATSSLQFTVLDERPDYILVNIAETELGSSRPIRLVAGLSKDLPTWAYREPDSDEDAAMMLFIHLEEYFFTGAG